MAALPTVQQQLWDQADTIFHRTAGPSLAAGIVLDDGLYFAHGVGYRDAAKHATADETTVYEVGSLTKVFTGTALLTMIDNPAGRKNPQTPMSLDDDVAQKYFPALDSVCPPPGGTPCQRSHTNLGITLRELVSHTSGLPDSIVFGNLNVNTDEATFTNKEIPNTWIIFKPGQLAAYSGDGTAINGLIIAHQSTEQSYPAYLHNHLLMPLGMCHSAFDHAQIPGNKLALKYDYNSSSGTFTAHPAYDDVPSSPPNATVLLPTAALFTSVWDLSRFMQMFLVGTAPNDSTGHAILQPATVAMATRSVVTLPGPPQPIGASCNGSFSATSNGYKSYYRGCESNAHFGVNWFVGGPPDPSPSSVFALSGPYAQHNGGLSDWETDTALDLDPNHKMGATVLISTDRGKANAVINEFFATALQQDIAATTPGPQGENPSWNNQPLAISVARLLWLLGTDAPPGSGVPKKPSPGSIPKKGKPGKPLPPGWVLVGNKIEMQALLDYQNLLLGQFTPASITDHSLTPLTVQAYVAQLRHGLPPCSTFRVRGVTNKLVDTLFSCGGQAIDVVATVGGASHQIAVVSSKVSADPY
jgi:CubicO group peptidase (beta-lactamase class C family)